MLVPFTARQTTDMAAAALASGRGAGLPELLELIQTLASRMEHISLDEISDLIEQDPVVAARLVNLANVIALNPGMTHLTTVAHAIHQIGFQRVRSLAISLMLLKSSGARQNPPEQRQAASRALCAGLMAQACARQVTAVDPEMVFACATLRQLGRIILPVVSIEHYRAVLAAAPEESEPVAFRRFFGLTPLELSREVLKSYKLPPEIRHALGDFTALGATGASPSAHRERLTGLADFGSQLTQIVLNVSLDEAGYHRETRALSTAFAASIPNADDLLVSTLQAAGERLAQFMQMPGVASGTEVILRRIRARLPKPEEAVSAAAPLETNGVAVPAGAPSQPLFSAAPFPPAGATPELPEAEAAAEKPAPSKETLPDAITLVPEPVQTMAPGEPWIEVLRPVKEGFGADDCVVFLRAAGNGPFILAEGLGTFAAHHQDIASVHPDERTVFSIALARRETVVIHDSRTPTLVPYLPAWFQADARTPGAFLLVPLAGSDQVDALVLVGWSKARRIELTAGNEAMLNLLRSSATRLCRESARAALVRTGS